MIYAHPQYEFGVAALEVALDGMGKMIAQIAGRSDLSETQVRRLKVFQQLVHIFEQVLPHYKEWVASSNLYDNEELRYDERAYNRILEIVGDEMDPSVEGSTTYMMVEFAMAIRELDQKTSSPSRIPGLAVMLPAYTIFHHIHNEFDYKCQRVPGDDQRTEESAPSEPV